MEDKNQANSTVSETHQILISLLEARTPVFYRFLDDGDLTFDYISDASLELTGYPAFELMDNKDCGLLQFIHKDDRTPFLAQLERSLAEDVPFQAIFRIQTKNFDEKWVITQGVVDKIGSAPHLFTGNITDITGKKELIEELQTQKVFYESTINKMPFELVVLDKNKRYLFINQTAMPDVELRDWIIGKTDFEFCQFRNKDLSIALKRDALLNRAIEDRAEIEWEEIHITREGVKKFSLKRYSPIIDSKDELKIIIGYGFDITDQRLAQEKVRENEQLLKSINANIQDGIYRYNQNYELIYINQAFSDMFGYEDMSEVLNDQNGFFSIDRKSRKELVSMLESRGAFKNKEVLFTKKNGGQFWGLVSGIRTQEDNGVIFYDGAIVDITELKNTEALLKQKNEELEKANAELDRFVYSASHDLRAPLTSILGIISVAEMDISDPETAQYFTMIKSSVKKLDDFVRDIIDYYRNNRLDTKQEPIQFAQVSQETFENFRYSRNASEISFINDIEETIPYYGDLNRIRIIFNNLISNAIKYHDDKKEKQFIALKIRTLKDRVHIEITDNGRGIEEKHQARIFDMFYRASQESVGSGLGLYIVREALRKMHGDISVESIPGQGTKFIITIPNFKVYAESGYEYRHAD